MAINPGMIGSFVNEFGSELKNIFKWTKGVSKELMGSKGSIAYNALNAAKFGEESAVSNASRYTTGMLRSMGYGAAGGAGIGAVYGAGESMMDRSGSTGLVSNMARRAAGFGLVGGIGGGLTFAGAAAWNRSGIGSEIKWAKKFNTLNANEALNEFNAML